MFTVGNLLRFANWNKRDISLTANLFTVGNLLRFASVVDNCCVAAELKGWEVRLANVWKPKCDATVKVFIASESVYQLQPCWMHNSKTLLMATR